MPQVQVKTTSSEQIWAKGDRVIFKVGLEWNGETVEAKTYSRAIAAVGWEGTVETYEKPGQNGSSDTFVKQPQREGGYSGYSPQGGSSGGSKPAYQPKDEAAIKAMWAIGQSVAAHNGSEMDVADFASIEGYAKELFSMVDRVKSDAATKEELDDFLNKGEDITEGGDTPWTPTDKPQTKLPV